MQRLKDGYRASFRLNENNSRHMEIYQMFEELMNSGEYQNESDLYREAIGSLYRKKADNDIADDRKAELQECARMTAYEVKGMVQEIIDGAIVDLKISSFSMAPNISDKPSNALENIGMKPPESSEVLSDDICDFMKALL